MSPEEIKQQILSLTKEYYKEMFMQEKNPLLFHGVPHILFRGSLDISGVKKFPRKHSESLGVMSSLKEVNFVTMWS